jgi:DNA-binding NarL/FixJ family response regulator
MPIILGGGDGLAETMTRITNIVPEARVFCLSQTADSQLLHTAVEAGAVAFMLKHEVRLQITWAIVYALEHDFTITAGIAREQSTTTSQRLYNAAILPEQRNYPEMTDRVRQAIKLCVIEGMPAHLAADEMGISLHTIRGYIKEGYRILEAYDHREYPTDMTPQERAFMRFTALADADDA